MIPFVGGSYGLNVRRADVQRVVNMCPVSNEVPGGKAVAYLESIPGLVQFSASASSSFLLWETGGYLLNQNGTRIVL